MVNNAGMALIGWKDAKVLRSLLCELDLASQNHFLYHSIPMSGRRGWNPVLTRLTNNGRRLGRLAAMLTMALALLIQMTVTAHGPDPWLCVCVAVNPVAQALAPCCQTVRDHGPAAPGPATPPPACDDCHQMPLPLAAGNNLVAGLPMPVVCPLPIPLRIAALHRPDPRDLVQGPGHNPPRGARPLQFLRVVVITC